MQDFKKLDVWKRSHLLAIDVRRATRAFPRSGFGSLKSQITNSAESTPFNIVEGCATDSRKEFARFLDISIKSSNELEYQLLLAKDYGILGLRQWQTLTSDTIEVRKMLCSLRRKVLLAYQRERDRGGREGEEAG